MVPFLFVKQNPIFRNYTSVKKYCLENWFRHNELILNIRKSCALSFHPRQRIRACKPRIIYNDQLIPYKTDVKFLGIQIAEQLSWNTHIKFICPNLNKAYFIIKMLKKQQVVKLLD
jgi:hypothetical protein